MPTIEIDVGASADDCRVYWNGSSWIFSSSTVYHETGYETGSWFKSGGGLRFQAVGVPQGAVIDVANIVFTCAAGTSVTVVRTRFTGEAVDDAAAFSALADYQARRGTVVGGADNDSITSTQVDWDDIPPWTTGSAYTSPDISAIVQEIVDRAGWVNGNDMVIFWDDHDNRSSQSGNRERIAASYDHAAYDPPKLHIEYTEGGVTSRTSSETGAGADGSSLLATVSGNDNASGSDGTLQRALASGDIGLGVDVGMIPGQKNLSGADAGSGGDFLEALVATSLGSDMKLPGRQSHVTIPSKGVSL